MQRLRFLTLTALAASCLCGLYATRAVARDKTAKVGEYTPRPRGTLTFSKDIAPIMMANCTQCHRAGEIGPFALENYTDFKKRATQIAQVTESRYMPPWHADSHGEFLDERKLTIDQIGELKQWADEGSPMGDPKLMPAEPEFPKGWSLGKPDIVLQTPAAFTVPAETRDIYRCFVLPTNVPEDSYVSAIEIRPGNSRVVHHVIAYLDGSGKAKKLEESNTDGKPGYSVGGGIGVMPSGALGGWAPGNLPRLYPDGIGTKLPKGTDVILQIHYHASGKAETDQTRIGIYLCKKPVDKRLRIIPVFAPLNIPAGDAHYTTAGKFPLPFARNVTLQVIMPHMHLLGKEMTVKADLPDHSEKTLIHVPNWDFNWQTNYEYKDPLKLPAGTTLSLTAAYDNSTANPSNPNSPPKSVRWGEQTTDEMCIAFVWYTIDDEHLTQGKPVTDLLDALNGFGAGAARRLQRRQSAPE